MKILNILKKAVLASLSVVSLSVLGCHDPIFYEVNREVEPVEPSVNGCIYDIVRCNLGKTDKEYLFVATGEIMYKDVTVPTPAANQRTSQWHKFMDLGKGNVIISNIAANEKYLYAMTFIFDENVDEGEEVLKRRDVWYYDPDRDMWDAVTGLPELPANGAKDCGDYDVIMFSSNAPMPSHRKAFILLGGKKSASGDIYELDGATATKIYTAATSTTPESYSGYTKADNNLTASSKGCAYLGDTLWFTSSRAIVSNEWRRLKSDGSAFEEKKSDILYYYDSGWKMREGTTSTATGPSLEPNQCALVDGALFVTTKSGLKKIKVNGDKTLGGVEELTQNGGSTLKSGTYETNGILVLDCEKTESGCEAYVSADFTGSSKSTSGQMKNVGLWSYYPERANWNRE